MENKEFKFKTNLSCSNCVSKIQNDFDNAQGIKEWKVETDREDKRLTVISKGISKEEIIKMIQGKGFTLESVS